ncbi:MAG: Maf family protein [Calditrichia bacterium]
MNKPGQNEFLDRLLNLKNKKIILASRSPRRAEMLKSLGLSFTVLPTPVEETLGESESPVDFVRRVALEKASWVKNKLPADLIIAADTVVYINNRILQKPNNADDAAAMLGLLSGATHQVVTGFCLLNANKQIVEHEITRVEFYALTDREIEAYVDSGEPMDKAGAYGIQGYASLFIKKVDGCYYNVVGFPLAKFYLHLKEIYWRK